MRGMMKRMQLGNIKNTTVLFVFEFQANQESMLYLSKITHPLEEHIIEKNYDKLNADYVQANNNGRWTLSAEFYNMVSPKYVFMDCSMETVNADEEEKGVGVYTDT